MLREREMSMVGFHRRWMLLWLSDAIHVPCTAHRQHGCALRRRGWALVDECDGTFCSSSGVYSKRGWEQPRESNVLWWEPERNANNSSLHVFGWLRENSIGWIRIYQCRWPERDRSFGRRSLRSFVGCKLKMFSSHIYMHAPHKHEYLPNVWKTLDGNIVLLRRWKMSVPCGKRCVFGMANVATRQTNQLRATQTFPIWRVCVRWSAATVSPSYTEMMPPKTAGGRMDKSQRHADKYTRGF